MKLASEYERDWLLTTVALSKWSKIHNEVSLINYKDSLKTFKLITFLDIWGGDMRFVP